MIGTVALLIGLAAPHSPSLHVAGTKILRSDGTEIRFHGINVPSLEWTAAGDHVSQSIPVALDKWGANLIRLPLSEDRWFGNAPDDRGQEAHYRTLVDGAVSQVAARGKHILLDLHWSNGGVIGQFIGQHALPDAESLAFWKDCAKRYANNPAVLFDLYNEPIEAPWNVWRDGGTVTETFQGHKMTYQAVGLQQLVDAIRSVGAKNVILAGGLGYSSRLDGILTHRLSDPKGHGVVYANHFYPGWEGVESWEKRVTDASRTLPIIIGEFGGDPQSLPLDFPKRRVAQVLAVLKKHDWNWSAWCMHPAASPCLISDWTYKPTEYFGVLVYKTLHGQSVPIPARQTRATDKVVYDDKLETQFQSWSSANVDFSSPTAHSGKLGIAVTVNAPGQQLQLGTVPFDGNPYRAIAFWVNGGSTGAKNLSLSANVMDKLAKTVPLQPVPPKSWKRFEISFDQLGIAGKEGVKSFSLHPSDWKTAPTFFVDDIVIEGRR